MERYFLLKLETNLCGTDSTILIKTKLSEEELESKYGVIFDDLAHDNMESFRSEDEDENEAYWILEEIDKEEAILWEESGFGPESYN